MSQLPPLTTSPLGPVAASQRIAALDILRGAALFGILLMNMESYSGPMALGVTGIDPHWSGADRIADALVYVLVQGKFFTLFSLLFGAGFAVMAMRAARAGRDFAPFFLRRTAALALFGLVHAVLVWSGDILLSYALVSLVLLGLLQLPRTWLPPLGVLTYLAGGLLLLLMTALMHAVLGDGAAEALETSTADALLQIADEREVLLHGSWLQASLYRLGDLVSALTGLLIVGPEILGMFLLGAWFTRSGALAEPERFARPYALLRWVAWPLGLAVAIGSAWWQPWQAPGAFSTELSMAWALNSVAGLLMSLGYLAWIMRWLPRLSWMAPAGRMALSNYIGQSLLCTWLFYGHGLGWLEQMPRVWQLPFAVALFSAQVMLSHWWLARWRFGPLEWLWRSMTYRQWQPMRRGTHATPSA